MFPQAKQVCKIQLKSPPFKRLHEHTVVACSLWSSLLPRILQVNYIPLNPDLYSAEHLLGSGAERPVVYAMSDVCRVYNKTCKNP